MRLLTASALFLLVAPASGSLRRLQTYTQLSDSAALMLERVNLERGAQGLPALCTSTKLQLAAQRHSDDQAATHFMNHTGSNGSTLAERVSAAGYDWRGVAENVAAGQIDVTAVMDAWMSSEGHRRNILGHFAMLGSAYAYTPEGVYNHFWTQDFGRSDTERCNGATGGPNDSTAAVPTTNETLSSSNSRDNVMSAPNGRESRGTFLSSSSRMATSLHLVVGMTALLLATI